MTTAVIVPSNRPERIEAFCKVWEPEFNHGGVRLIVCEDQQEQTAHLPEWVEHFCWTAIRDRMGAHFDLIPIRSGGIRDFGFWLAAQDKDVDVFISLDDDVVPTGPPDVPSEFVDRHLHALDTGRHPRWWPVATNYYLTRGYPYSGRDSLPKPVINHGLWLGEPDVDAVHQLTMPAFKEAWGMAAWGRSAASETVPSGMYFPMSIMNVAWKRCAVPLMYMAPLPPGFERWDDIWCGVIAKKVCDSLGWPVTSGTPSVHHTRASNPLANLKREMLGYGIHERLWQVVDGVRFSNYEIGCGDLSATERYVRVVDAVTDAFPELARATDCMRRWAGLWRGWG